MSKRPEGPYRTLIRKLMGPLPELYGTNQVQRLVGFFILWHLLGGDDALRKAGWSDTTIWRCHRDFRTGFGTKVEVAWPELAAAARAMAGPDGS